MKKQSTSTQAVRISCLACLLLALLLGVGGRAEGGTVIRFGHQQPTTHAFHAASLEMAKSVAEKTHGRLDVRVLPAGQMGDEKAQIEQVKLGSLQMFLATYGALGQWLPSITVFEAPYVIKSMPHFRNVERSRLYKESVDKLAREFNMRILGSWYLGTRQMVTRNFAVRKPDDLAGKKLRVPDATLYVEMAKAMGASPTPFAYAEVYLGLQQGVLDAAENPIPSMYSFKYYEVTKYLILTSHLIQCMPMIVTEDFYRKLSQPDQQALEEAVTEAGRKVSDQMLTDEKRLIEQFKGFGVTVITPDVKAFAERVVKALPAQFESKWGKGVLEEVYGMPE